MKPLLFALSLAVALVACESAPHPEMYLSITPLSVSEDFEIMHYWYADAAGESYRSYSLLLSESDYERMKTEIVNLASFVESAKYIRLDRMTTDTLNMEVAYSHSGDYHYQKILALGEVVRVHLHGNSRLGISYVDD